ncbi:MAG: MFS transporter [Enterobacter hormaechei]
MNTSVVSPGRAGLILLLTGQMLPLIDTSITNVALDSITHSLHATATELELIVALYGVAFAVCLAPGSKLGDNLGRRRLFMWGGVFWPRLAAVRHGGQYRTVAWRAHLQGAGAALIMPQILATLHVTLKGTAHARAISLFGDRRNCIYRRPDGWRLAGVGGHRRAGLAQRLLYQRADLSGGAGAEPSLRAGKAATRRRALTGPGLSC